MITREDVRELARFQLNGNGTCALSFYFQPGTPQNKSHREEAILTKDLVREALRAAEAGGKNDCARADLDRILQLASTLRGNGPRAKAVFACAAKSFWREFDLPPQLPGTQLSVNRRFHLKPVALLLGAMPRLCVALVDRHKARIFDLRLGELTEREGLFRPLPHRGRGDGFAGYDGGHAQRSVNDEARHHFKNVAEALMLAQEKGVFEKLILGCHDSNWPEFEPLLHPYVKQRLLGRFSAEVGRITPEQIREQAERILRAWQETRRRDTTREVISQARSNARGVTGLRRVLRSLELGEVQSLLIGEKYSAHAVECTNCGHLDAHIVRFCPVCGHGTREIDDVCEAILPLAIRRDIEVFYVKDDPEFDRVGNIAALLRFRADQNTGARLAAGPGLATAS